MYVRAGVVRGGCSGFSFNQFPALWASPPNITIISFYYSRVKYHFQAPDNKDKADNSQRAMRRKE
jgi:hypothetical protein